MEGAQGQSCPAPEGSSEEGRRGRRGSALPTRATSCPLFPPPGPAQCGDPGAASSTPTLAGCSAGEWSRGSVPHPVTLGSSLEALLGPGALHLAGWETIRHLLPEALTWRLFCCPAPLPERWLRTEGSYQGF